MQKDSWIADRKLWLTADGDVVEDGDPASAVLYATPGTVIPREDAEAKGLVEPRRSAEEKAEAEAEAAKAKEEAAKAELERAEAEAKAKAEAEAKAAEETEAQKQRSRAKDKQRKASANKSAAKPDEKKE